MPAPLPPGLTHRRRVAVEVVGRGLHIHVIVDKPKIAERLAAKKAQATALGGAFIDS